MKTFKKLWTDTIDYIVFFFLGIAGVIVLFTSFLFGKIGETIKKIVEIKDYFLSGLEIALVPIFGLSAIMAGIYWEDGALKNFWYCIIVILISAIVMYLIFLHLDKKKCKSTEV